MSTARRSDRKTVTFHGVGVSPGVVVGKAHLFSRGRDLMEVPDRKVPKAAVAGEILRLEEALIETRRQIKGIQRDLEEGSGLSDVSILDAHLMVLDDRAFIEEVVTEIRQEQRNVEAAVRDVAMRYAKVLGAVEDEYLRERVADVKDVVRRLIRSLMGEGAGSTAWKMKGRIVVASDLAPSEAASLGREKALGLATDVGSPTSHVAVMARALQIPALVGLHDVSSLIGDGDEVLIDGTRGVLILRPTPAQLREYGHVSEARRRIERRLHALRRLPAQTADGRRIVLSANAETPEEIDAVIKSGAEGVGLFRSEYLYFSRNKMVGEEEETAAFREVASRLAPAPVIIRTLDIGGDKFMREEGRPREANPFLGCRSIRLSLRHPDHFKSQLRAVLRASALGNVKIMYPMISNAGEIVRANELLEEAKRDLQGAGEAFNPDIEVGVMIEIPGAALTADALAKHVRFFSLGTNDLVQYTLAVDRVNERVSYLYEPTHPAVLKLIRMTIEAGRRHGIWVGVCGEMAADPLMTGLLLGLGVDELSVAPGAVPMVKDAVRSVDMARAGELAARALECGSAKDVVALCRKQVEECSPELLQLI